MRGIHHHQIKTRLHHGFSTFYTVLITCPDGRATAQGTIGIFCGMRVQFGFFNIFDGDQTNTIFRIIHHQQFFNAVFMEQLAGFVLINRVIDPHQIFGCHQFTHRNGRIIGKAHIAVG